MRSTVLVTPGTFVNENHWYPKALNATIHPMVNFFLNLDKSKIVTRYCHLKPTVDRQKLEELLSYQCRYFLWSGADLFNATSREGKRQMVIIENNSCPSGHKSMPLTDDHKEDGSYRLLVENTFKDFVKPSRGVAKLEGCLGVIYDKNHMETSGYAAVIADVFKENVFLIPCFDDDSNEHLKSEDGILYVRYEGEWKALRALFRYVTQKPWNRLPLFSRTKILNPIIACLAGGRNKLMASKAYDLFNSELTEYGMKINTPETIWDISKDEIPLWVNKLGGHAVVKIPYSNAGQGVYTITSKKELHEFMEMDFAYERFIVQGLIGNYNWSSIVNDERYYHVGTIPTSNGSTYVADIRMMVSSTKNGIKPLCIYSRRAKNPLTDYLEDGSKSWDMLGTNLSVKIGENDWGSDTNRLMLMDRRDFNKLGLGLDDLIEGFIQTVISTIAIDKMCKNLISSKGKFKVKLFTSLNNDSTLLNEILM